MSLESISNTNISNNNHNNNNNSNNNSNLHNGINRPQIEIWEPTYRMKPSENEKFIPKAVENIIKDIMDKRLKKAKFDDSKCKQLALELCAEIKESVKELNIPRYKVVLQSVIGEVKGQGLDRISTEFLDI